MTNLEILFAHSGVDNTVCSYGGMIAYRAGAPMSRRAAPSHLRILLIDTRQEPFTCDVHRKHWEKCSVTCADLFGRVVHLM